MFDADVDLGFHHAPPILTRTGGERRAANWAAAHRGDLDLVLRRHGAVVLRGFDMPDVDAFEAVADALTDSLYGDYGDLPHEQDADRVYQSTPYPSQHPILFHHESSHMPQWPGRQFFCCVRPAVEGGATPIVDGRRVYEDMEPAVRDRFESVGIRYVRNFVEGLDVHWATMFGTDSRAEVERRCAAQDVRCEWLPGGTLRTTQWAPAVIRHPRTAEPVFFNQLFLHHTACLEDSVREALGALFGTDEAAFPRSACYGDGSPIDAATVHQLRSQYDRLAMRFAWQRGDVAVIDNMLVAHGRDPYAGERKILVAMGDMVTRREVAGTPGRPRETVR